MGENRCQLATEKKTAKPNGQKQNGKKISNKRLKNQSKQINKFREKKIGESSIQQIFQWKFEIQLNSSLFWLENRSLAKLLFSESFFK